MNSVDGTTFVKWQETKCWQVVWKIVPLNLSKQLEFDKLTGEMFDVWRLRSVNKLSWLIVIFRMSRSSHRNATWGESGQRWSLCKLTDYFENQQQLHTFLSVLPCVKSGHYALNALDPGEAHHNLSHHILSAGLILRHPDQEFHLQVCAKNNRYLPSS